MSGNLKLSWSKEHSFIASASPWMMGIKIWKTRRAALNLFSFSVKKKVMFAITMYYFASTRQEIPLKRIYLNTCIFNTWIVFSPHNLMKNVIVCIKKSYKKNRRVSHLFEQFFLLIGNAHKLLNKAVWKVPAQHVRYQQRRLKGAPTYRKKTKSIKRNNLVKRRKRIYYGETEMKMWHRGLKSTQGN